MDRPLRVGVTGHRALADRQQAIDRVRACVHGILMSESCLRGEQIHLTVLSCLAEGADRLVAAEVLSQPNATLVAVLPFDEVEYLTGFSDDASRLEFKTLLSRAAEIVTMPVASTREFAYELASRYVVDNSDVLIALWDGTHSKAPGGTAATLEYARTRQEAFAIHVLRVDRPRAGCHHRGDQ